MERCQAQELNTLEENKMWDLAKLVKGKKVYGLYMVIQS